jgi:hypothetical protein
MAAATPPNNYSIELKMLLNGQEMVTKDVNTFYVYRTPLVKYASFATVTLPLPTGNFLNISDTLKKGEDLQLTLTITLLNKLKDGLDTRERKDDKLITRKTYKILYIESREKVGAENQLMNCTMYLTNPVLFYLSTVNSFNKIIENSNSLDALKEFEGFMSQYGDISFDHKIGVSTFNTKIHEQIMVRSKNDLTIPTLLQSNFKVIDHFAYYFWDDFRITDDNSSDICGIFISFNNLPEFNKANVFSDGVADFQMGSKEVGITPIQDVFDSLLENDATMIATNYETFFKKYKGNDPSVPKTKSKVTPSSINEDRKINAVEATHSSVTVPTTKQFSIYSSDPTGLHKSDNAMTRFSNMSKFVREEVQDVYDFQNDDCHPDYLQFDRIYAFDLHVPFDLKYIPISIVNIFSKENPRETIMKHSAKWQCLRFNL